MTSFEIGKTYWDRSACDYDCVFTITVAKRTAKSITTTDGKRLFVTVYNGVETVKPFGSYSMCAMMSADRVLTDEPIVEVAPVETSDERARRLRAAFYVVAA